MLRVVHLEAGQLGSHHGEVGLAAGRGEGRTDVLLALTRHLDSCSVCVNCQFQISIALGLSNIAKSVQKVILKILNALIHQYLGGFNRVG